ncbi:MAG TPA: hypothetical protein VHE61_23260 [Opitutaceae bacterium]|nr:hypothetical protein [Opitutaceae bacterium]
MTVRFRTILFLLPAILAASLTGCSMPGSASTPAPATKAGAAKPAEPAKAPPAASQGTVSLAGVWRFALDRGDAGVKEQWFDRALANRINLPGILQAQGYGDEISTTTPWVTTLGDAWWKLQPESLRAKFSQPGKVKVPFLSQPPRHYLGAAWYQRDVSVPATAEPRRYVLFLERAHWETTVWLDGRAYAPDVSLGAPHVTDLGMLTPGPHHLTIRVDNRQIVRDPVNDGHQRDAHSVSDALGATWNGIVGRIELQSTPLVWLQDIQAFPNITTRSVQLRITIGNLTRRPGSGTISAGNVSVPVTWAANGGSATVDVPLGDSAQLWEEFHPVLNRLTVTLRVGDATDARKIVFGLREVVHRDKDLIVNGRVVNLRMTHFGGDFPLTGYPAMDVESWKHIFFVCQEYGLNGMRFHSWCPPDAAFTAADEVGFFLQPECGLWAPFNPGSPYTQFLEAETARLIEAYGNHPSFLLLSPSNEPSGRYTQITPKWAAEWYAKDPRRLYSAGTGWAAREQVTGGAQYATLVRFDGHDLRNVRGWFGHDYRAALENVHIPVLAHEVGQWCAYPDFDVIKEFKGYLRPGNFEIFKYLAAQNGVLDQDKAFAWASGRFQLECYKEDIEANLRTPGLSGYQLLDLHDYLGQGTALIGAAVDAFWKPKLYVTAEEFHRFNGPTVPLARLGARTFTSDETLSTDVELYHFGAAPIAGARPYWRIVDAHGRPVIHGEFSPLDVPIGKNIPLGRISTPLAQLPAPAAYKLVVGLAGTAIENDWNIWVYPAHVSATPASDVLVTSNWSEARARLGTGGKVLFIPGPANFDPARSPTMSRLPVFWNIQMTVRPPRNPTPKFDAMLGLLCDTKSPALAEFPTAANCDWQWTPLINGVRSVNLNGLPAGLHPIVATIDDWNRDWRLGVVFECRVGRGRLLVSVIDFTKPNATPGARQLGRSLLDYMHGDRFQPAVTLSATQADALWKSGTPGDQPRARVFDPDLDDGSGHRPPNKR